MKRTYSDILSRLDQDGCLAKSTRKFNDREARMRDQSEIGRLKAKIHKLEEKNKELSHNYNMLVEEYMEMKDFIKNYREGE